MITDAELNKLAEEWVTFNKSWDHYECDWINSGVDTFKAGYRAAEERFRKLTATSNWDGTAWILRPEHKAA